MAAGERIFEVLDVEPEVEDKPDAYPLPPIVGRVDLRPRHLRLRRDAEILHDIDLHGRAGRDGRLRRRDRGRQELDDQPADALLRRLGRRASPIDGHDVRDVTQAVAPLADWGSCCRTPSSSAARCATTSASAGRTRPTPRSSGRRGRSARTTSSSHLPDGYDTEVQERGRQPLGRAAAAALLRPGAAGRPAHPDPGRGDQQRSTPQTERADPGGAAPPAARPDHLRHRPPPHHDPRGRQGGGDAPRPDRRGRAPTTSCMAGGGYYAQLHAAQWRGEAEAAD